MYINTFTQNLDLTFDFINLFSSATNKTSDNYRSSMASQRGYTKQIGLVSSSHRNRKIKNLPGESEGERKLDETWLAYLSEISNIKLVLIFSGWPKYFLLVD